MERRKFFKSLGALGLAAIIPKFLIGKEDKENNIKNWEDKTHSFTDVSYVKTPDFNNEIQPTAYVSNNIELRESFNKNGLSNSTSKWWMYDEKLGVIWFDENNADDVKELERRGFKIK